MLEDSDEHKIKQIREVACVVINDRKWRMRLRLQGKEVKQTPYTAGDVGERILDILDKEKG